MKKSLVYTIISIGMLLCLASVCGADINYDFVNQDGQVEDKVAPMVRKILEIIIGIGVGLCMIAAAIGGCQWFGQFMREDKDSGIKKVKSAGIGIIVFGVFWSIMSTAFNIAGISS